MSPKRAAERSSRLGGAVAKKRFDPPSACVHIFGGPGGHEFAWSCSVMDRNSGSFRGRGFGGTWPGIC